MNQELQVGLQGGRIEGGVPSNETNTAGTAAQLVPPVKRGRGRPRKIRPEIAQPLQIAKDCGRDKKE